MHVALSIIAPSEHHADYVNHKGWVSVNMQGVPIHWCVHRMAGTNSLRQGFPFPISIDEVRTWHCSEIEPCKPKPIGQKFKFFCLGTPHIWWTSGYNSHSLKFDKGTIYRVYFIWDYTGLYRKDVSLFLDQMNICDNKLRSCAQFAPRCICSPPNSHHLKMWSKFAPGCKFAPRCIF